MDYLFSFSLSFSFSFFIVFVIVFVFSCRPFRGSNLVPRLAVVGVVLPLSSRTAAAVNKNTLDYDVVPADGVEPPQGHAGRGMG